MVNVDTAGATRTQAEATAEASGKAAGDRPPRTRYALVGTGSRSEMYVRAILGQQADVVDHQR